MRPRTLVLLTAAVFLLYGGCEGGSFGENTAGGDTWMEGGSIAVDPTTETIYVLQQRYEEEPAGPYDDAGSTTVRVSKHLYAISQAAGSAKEVLDLEGYDDIRVLFPEGSVLVMAEDEDGHDTLFLLDPESFYQKASKTTSATYHGTRLSPSKRYLAVADGAQETAPIVIYDTTTLDSWTIPHSGDWLEAMWASDEDLLVAAIFQGQLDDDGEDPSLRVVAWSFEEQSPEALAESEDGIWGNRALDVSVAGAEMDMLFSFTWVGVDPLGRYAVIPVRAQGPPAEEVGGDTWHYQLVVVDLDAGSVQTVDGVQGPVGFSPDGATIVGHKKILDSTDKAIPYLALVDAATLAEDKYPLPYDNGPQYFVTHEDNLVVVTPSYVDGGPLFLYDFDNRTLGTVSGPVVHLTEFVSRVGFGELWLLDKALFRFDFEDELLEVVPLDWVPEHIAYVPSQDELVLDDNVDDRIVFYDPATKTIDTTVPYGEE